MPEDDGAGIGSYSPASSTHSIDSFHSASNELSYNFDASKGQLSFAGKTYYVNVLQSGSWVSAKSDSVSNDVAKKVNTALQELLSNLGNQEFETAEFYNTGEYRYKTDADSDFISESVASDEQGEYKSQIRQVYLIIGGTTTSSTTSGSGKRRRRRDDDSDTSSSAGSDVSSHSSTSSHYSRYMSAEGDDESDFSDDESVATGEDDFSDDSSVGSGDDRDDDSVYMSVEGDEDRDDISVYESLPGDLDEDRAADLALEDDGEFDDDGGHIEGEMGAMGAVFGANLMAAGEPDEEGHPASFLDRSIAAVARKFLGK